MADETDLRQQLSAYMDGELSPDQADRMDQALRDDPALAGELESLRATRRMVRQLPRVSAPPELLAQVLAKAERSRLSGPDPDRTRASTGAMPWVRRLASAAVLLIAFGVGGVILVTLWVVSPPAGELPEPALPESADPPPRPPVAMHDGDPRSSEPATTPPSAGGVHRKSTAPDRRPRVGPAGAIPPPEEEVMILTGDLDATNGRVQRILMDSGVSPAFGAVDVDGLMEANALAARQEGVMQSRPGSAGFSLGPDSVYTETGGDGRSIRLRVYATVDQCRQIQSELADLQRNLLVPQVDASAPPAGRTTRSGESRPASPADPGPRPAGESPGAGPPTLTMAPEPRSDEQRISDLIRKSLAAIQPSPADPNPSPSRGAASIPDGAEAAGKAGPPASEGQALQNQWEDAYRQRQPRDANASAGRRRHSRRAGQGPSRAASLGEPSTSPSAQRLVRLTIRVQGLAGESPASRPTTGPADTQPADQGAASPSSSGLE